MRGPGLRRARRAVAAVLVALVAGATAAAATATPLAQREAFQVVPGSMMQVPVNQGTILRTVDLYVPPLTVSVPSIKPKPLILVLHAWHQSTSVIERMTGFDALAESGDAIVAYPRGLGDVGHESWNAGTCCGYATTNHIDDVGFLAATVQTISNLTLVDRNRIFVVGWSNGAMMALKAACDRPDIFRAAVSVSGTLESTCEAGPAVSALMINGLRDKTVPYSGLSYSTFLQGPVAPVPSTVKTLIDRSVCKVRRHSVVGDQATDLYLGCADRSVIESLVVKSFGHDWPTLRDWGFDGTQIAWRYLSALEPR